MYYNSPELNIYSSFINCKQGSDEWHNLRKNSIGGSSASITMDKNPFKLRDSFIMEQASGITNVESQNIIAMAHGTLMEDLNRQVASAILCVPIYEAGIYTNKEGMHFSPDGIGIDLAGRSFICEFKTPYTRQVAKKGKVYHFHILYKCNIAWAFFPLNIVFIKT